MGEQNDSCLVDISDLNTPTRDTCWGEIDDELFDGNFALLMPLGLNIRRLLQMKICASQRKQRR